MPFISVDFDTAFLVVYHRDNGEKIERLTFLQDMINLDYYEMDFKDFKVKVKLLEQQRDADDAEKL